MQSNGKECKSMQIKADATIREAKQRKRMQKWK